MKEIDRIVYLRELRNERRKVESLISTYPKETYEYFKEIMDKDTKPIGSLDYYINEKGNCEHEYGITNHRESFNNKNVMCLDCGEYIDEKDSKIVLETTEKLSTVRNSYLEKLLSMSVCESYMTLKKDYNLK